MSTNDNRITKLMAEQFGIAETDIKPNSRLIEDLGADSLDKIEVVMAVEDEFGLQVPDPVGDAWTTVQDVIDFINRKTK
ncbi:MAG: acyl carrier protein [Burkholderiaceae bacterium]|nr:acyl carrier protein [Burkholderiaceae bacterium]